MVVVQVVLVVLVVLLVRVVRVVSVVLGLVRLGSGYGEVLGELWFG